MAKYSPCTLNEGKSEDDFGESNQMILAKPEDMSIFESALEKKLCGHTNPTHFKIFVAGETGEGKSTLINSIVERKVAETGCGAKKCTEEVKEYKKLNITPVGISVSLFDSPGLNDCSGNEDKYIRALEETCQEVDLVLYCKKLGDRLKDGDKAAMLKLTDRFGEKFWSYVMFVHTCANKIGRDDIESDESSDDSDTESVGVSPHKFESFLQKEKTEIKKHLKEEVQVDHSFVNEIPFVPAGKYRRHHSNKHSSSLQLPDRANWLQSMLEECCHQIKDKHKFKKLNLSHRFHLAIIINNDIESSQHQADTAQPQAGGAQSISLPTTPNSDQVKCTLEALGYHVLYFDSLTSDNIERLLDAFSTADHTDLAAFGLIVFSSGMSPHIHDANGQVVEFEKIFKHFPQSVDIPKFFFFHLNGTSRKDIQLPNLPSKSIALAVSVDSPQSDISPAVRSFENEMKNDTEPIVDVFRKIVTQCRQSATCKGKYTFHEKFILPVCYEVANEDLVDQRSKQLKFCHSMWYRVRHNTIDSILQSKDEVLDAVRKARKAKIATSAISLVGGGLTLAGLILIPFTFGGSIALSVAGVGIGATSTLGGSAAYIYMLVKNNERLKTAQRNIEFDQKFNLNVYEVANRHEEAVQSYILAERINSVAAVGRLGLGVGKGIAVGVQGAAETASLAVWSTGRIVGSALGGVALAISAPIDIANIIYHGSHLVQSNKDESGKFDSDEICQFLIKQSEQLLISLFHFNKMKFEILKSSTTLKEFKTENGFSLYVIRGTLKEKEQCQVSVAAIFSGSFKIPAGATLVSAIYDVTIAHDEKTKLQKPLHIAVQHCVDVTDSNILSNMCFAFAECDLKNKIFEFKKLVRGRIGKERGTIEVKESCRLCILYFERDIDVVPIKYVAISCDQRKSKNIWKKTIVLIKDLPTHIQYAKEKQLLTDKSVAISFKFKQATSPQIILEKFSQTNNKSGWSIFRDKVPNKISKCEIDTVEFQEFPKLPVIKLNVAAFDERAMQIGLNHEIPLVGAVFLDGTDANILFEFSYYRE